MKVYQVIVHGLTGGRDSGYPTTTSVGPLFGTKRAAQDEANRLLAKSLTKTMLVPKINPVTGTYDFSNRIEKPLYEAVEVEVLTQRQADARMEEFLRTAIDDAEAKAARLEAEATKIREAIK